ncbi:MAG: aminoacetone oxidase family FAD-binding enzyme [Salibacteraceae bacterium]
MKVAVIGAGAAGYFAAISAKEKFPDAEVTLLEKSTKILSKVLVSGGGRCNVTHACFEISKLTRFYPRGARFLKKAFHQFNTNHTVVWFQERGVKLKTESDNRMFPFSDSSQTIINCLMSESERLGIKVNLQTAISSIVPHDEGFNLTIGEYDKIKVDNVIVATGGSSKEEGLNWLKELGHTVVKPVPSLFTFNMPNEPIKELMGLVAPEARVKIQGSKLSAVGPLLITHWGMSGPAILKLSAFGARELADFNYNFTVLVNWVNVDSEDDFRKDFISILESSKKGKLGNLRMESIPKRLWSFILDKLELDSNSICGELSKKNINRIINTLLNDEFKVEGKTTFKEEFVTCGGVALNQVDPQTMESKIVPNLYFAGEVLDIDGVTGGFNFQAAWTTGYIAGKLQSPNRVIEVKEPENSDRERGRYDDRSQDDRKERGDDRSKGKFEDRGRDRNYRGNSDREKGRGSDRNRNNGSKSDRQPRKFDDSRRDKFNPKVKPGGRKRI